jgi:hypothetical protein
LDGSSTIGSAEFDFDDDVVNSTVYRRAMATATKRHKMKRTKSLVEGDLIDLSELGSDDENAMAESSTRDLEELRDGSTLKAHTRTGTMETLQEEQEPNGDSPRSRRIAADQRSQASMGFRVTGPVHTHLYPPGDGRAGAHTPTMTIASYGATIDSQSTKSIETR